MERRIMITVTKKDLIALGYGTSFSADIIRKAKKLMIEKGHTYYQSRKLDRVPKEAVEELLGITLSVLEHELKTHISDVLKSWQKTLLRKQITGLIISELI